MKLAYQEIARLVASRRNCLADESMADWAEKHTQSLLTMVENVMPHGSGIDNGVSIDLERSTPECLVFSLPFHHMDENGYYDGWTDYTVKVRASLLFSIELRISGRDRNGLKDYLHEMLEYALTRPVVWNVQSASYVLHVEPTAAAVEEKNS